MALSEEEILLSDGIIIFIPKTAMKTAATAAKILMTLPFLPEALHCSDAERNGVISLSESESGALEIFSQSFSVSGTDESVNFM